MREREPLTEEIRRDLCGLLACVVERLRPGTEGRTAGITPTREQDTRFVAIEAAMAVEDALRLYAHCNRAVSDNLMTVRALALDALANVDTGSGVHEWLDRARQAVVCALQGN